MQMSSAADDSTAAQLRLVPDLAGGAAAAGLRPGSGLHTLSLVMDVRWPLSVIISQVGWCQAS